MSVLIYRKANIILLLSRVYTTIRMAHSASSRSHTRFNPRVRWLVVYCVVITNKRSGSGWLSRYSDALRTGRSGDRIPVEARFSAPVQTGPGIHADSSTMGAGSFPGVKRLGRGVDHPVASSTKVEERIEQYIYCSLGVSWPLLG